ncbi:hypothetical protein [Salmonirosea aquatica]|uniref:Uncharacterized protein n=1 Tax=Salmonirosea aquatica TaxID=2654236 RepID=A0A7C9FPY7_9BACT|nr:hypothetical protein [Cytophagaceae bacterium SJW1-29]
MNRILVCIALLLGSVRDPLLAQNDFPDPNFDTKLDAEAFKKEYPSLLDATSFEVKLSKGNILLLIGKKYSQLKLVQRPDLLVRQFWAEYSPVIEKLPEDTDGTSVQYVLNDDDDEPQLRWKKYPQGTPDFTVVDKELVRLKTVQDTLHITMNKADQQAELYLLANDLRDIPLLLDEIREKTTYLLTSMEKRTDPVVLDRSPEVYGRYLGNRQVQLVNFGSDMLIFNPRVGLGYIRGHWMTSLDLGATLYLEKSPIKPTVGYQHQYFFGQNAEGGFKAYQNGFVLAGLSFFKKSEKGTIGRKPVVQTGQLTVGYLVQRRGTYYEPRTWRVTGAIDLTPHLRVAPEVYFNGTFKNLTPGLRLSVGL